MEESKRRIQITKNRNVSVSRQYGFTYLEFVISLFILLMMIPVVFYCLIHFVTEGQKIMDQERYQMNWLSCYVWMQRELKSGKHFRMEKEALLFDLPTGETIRYQWDKGRIVRQVRTHQNQPFKGYTVLLQHVQAHRFVPYQTGVLLIFTFDNNSSVQTFIRGRIENHE